MPRGRTWEDQGDHVDEEGGSKDAVEGASSEAIANVDARCAHNASQANRSLPTFRVHGKDPKTSEMKSTCKSTARANAMACFLLDVTRVDDVYVRKIAKLFARRRASM